MKRRFDMALAVTVAAGALALSGCQSQAQKEVDKQAKAIDNSYEAEADLKEAIAAGQPNSVQAQAHNEAEQLRNQGEAVKDRLQDDAKELKNVPKK